MYAHGSVSEHDSSQIMTSNQPLPAYNTQQVPNLYIPPQQQQDSQPRALSATDSSQNYSSRHTFYSNSNNRPAQHHPIQLDPLNPIPQVGYSQSLLPASSSTSSLPLPQEQVSYDRYPSEYSNTSYAAHSIDEVRFMSGTPSDPGQQAGVSISRAPSQRSLYTPPQDNTRQRQGSQHAIPMPMQYPPQQPSYHEGPAYTTHPTQYSSPISEVNSPFDTMNSYSIQNRSYHPPTQQQQQYFAPNAPSIYSAPSSHASSPASATFQHPTASNASEYPLRVQIPTQPLTGYPEHHPSYQQQALRQQQQQQQQHLAQQHPQYQDTRVFPPPQRAMADMYESSYTIPVYTAGSRRRGDSQDPQAIPQSAHLSRRASHPYLTPGPPHRVPPLPQSVIHAHHAQQQHASISGGHNVALPKNGQRTDDYFVNPSSGAVLSATIEPPPLPRWQDPPPYHPKPPRRLNQDRDWDDDNYDPSAPDGSRKTKRNRGAETEGKPSTPKQPRRRRVLTEADRAAQKVKEEQDKIRQEQLEAIRSQRRQRFVEKWDAGTWSTHRALERYEAVAKSFDELQFSAEAPIHFEAIPWPLLHASSMITLGRVRKGAVESFFQTVKSQSQFTREEFRSFYESCFRRFHADTWRDRGLYETIEDETEREALEAAVLVVSQSMSTLWDKLVGKS